MKQVVVVIGAGSIGHAIACRVSAGKHVLLADLRRENAEGAAAVLASAGFEVSTATVDVASRDLCHASGARCLASARCSSGRRRSCTLRKSLATPAARV